MQSDRPVVAKELLEPSWLPWCSANLPWNIFTLSCCFCPPIMLGQYTGFTLDDTPLIPLRRQGLCTNQVITKGGTRCQGTLQGTEDWNCHLCPSNPKLPKTTALPSAPCAVLCCPSRKETRPWSGRTGRLRLPSCTQLCKCLVVSTQPTRGDKKHNSKGRKERCLHPHGNFLNGHCWTFITYTQMVLSGEKPIENLTTSFLCSMVFFFLLSYSNFSTV